MAGVPKSWVPLRGIWGYIGLHTVTGFRDSFSGFPKLRGTILGVPVRRMILNWAVC